LLGAFHPDVAHVHAPSRYLTPSVLRPLERAGVPIVHALHDYKPWCTNRVLYAHGRPCERCRGGAHWHAAATACVQDSRGKSIVGSAEAYLHDLLGAYRGVRFWIAQSAFVRDKAVSLGADAGRVRMLPHGVEDSPAPPRPADRGEPYVLFMGRLVDEKGVRALPTTAARIAPAPLVVAGSGPLGAWLTSQGIANLHVAGHVVGERLHALRAHAAVVVVPSLFPETFGYSVAEALLDARPVVASRIGALPELVEHEVTGLLAPPGDDAAFAEATRRALADPAAASWGEAGRERVQRIGDVDAHVRGLLAIYEEARRG
jgi:glycosyltransferase involved in cell wall biosynthesis